MVPLVYSPGYNITACGLERLHPFDSLKYRRIHDWLIQQGLRRPGDFVEPRPVSRHELLKVHTPEYLDSLRQREVLTTILEVPLIWCLPLGFVRWRVLRPMRWAAGGTALACRLARQYGLAINLGGGFHHAGRDRGEGFCVYADVPLGLQRLHEAGQIRSALVVDTDAHQGNGNANVLRAWPWAHVLDFFNQDNFPWPKEEEEVPVPLPPGIGGAEYLARLQEQVPAALVRFSPDLVAYNAGSDVLRTDPLGNLGLTAVEMAERDLFVVSEARRCGVPLAMVLSGGYGPLSWEAHARSIEGILTRFDSEIGWRPGAT
jgi:histone deacetylase 11